MAVEMDETISNGIIIAASSSSSDVEVEVVVVVECGEEDGNKLNFNSSQPDPTNVVLHCNINATTTGGGDDDDVILHEIHHNTKDDADADGSYVFVNDADTVDDQDPTPTVVSDLNSNHVQVVDDDELNLIHDCPAPNAAAAVVDKIVDRQNCDAAAAAVQGNQESVLVAGPEAASSLSELHNQDEDDDDETVSKEENKLEPDEKDSESHVMVAEETVESESRGKEEEETETAKAAEDVENPVEVVEQSELKNEVVDTKPIHHHLDNNGEANVGEESNFDAAAAAEDADHQIQESQDTNIGETIKLESHQIDTTEEEKVVVVEEEHQQSKSDSDTTTKVNENEDQETKILESQVHQLVAEDDKEAEKESPEEEQEEEPSVQFNSQRDLNLETEDISPVDESNLNQEEARQVVEQDQDTQNLGAAESTESQLVHADDDKETEIEEALEEKTSGTHVDLNSESVISPEDDSLLLDKEAKDVGEDGDTQILGTTESVESELHHLVNEDDKETEKENPVEEEPSGEIGTQRDLNLETNACPLDDDSQFDKEAKDVEGDQDTQVLGAESVESVELHQLDNGCKKETENEASVEEPSGDICTQRDLNVETAICLAEDDSQLDKEAANKSEESVAIFPVQCTSIEPEVNSNAAEEQENVSVGPIDTAESEPDNVSGSVENIKSLSSIAVNSKSEKDVGDIPVEGEGSLPSGPAECGATESAVANGSGEYESFPTPSVEDSKATTTSGEVVPTCSLDETSTVAEVGNGPNERGESMSTCSVDDNVTSEAEIGNKSTESNHSISTLLVGDAGIESEAINACVERGGSNVPACSNDEPEQELASKMDIPSGENGAAVDSASMSNCANDVIDTELVGDRSKSEDINGKAICAEDEGVVKRPFRFLIRIPRYVDDKIREEIRLAQLQVDERTQSRDAIRAAIQSERATCSEFRDKFETARSDERAARDVLNGKRQEMDSVQSVITRIKNATSIDEIDDRIHNMEHMIQHETMPLKEEKQLIREIKQLKNLRDQLSSSLGKQAEEQPTLEERDRIEERFKLLKRESASTRTEVLQFEGITKAARKIYFDKNEKIRELQSQFRAADDLRQEAYIHLQNLKKQLYEKNKYFRMYKEDVNKAEDLAFAGDKEELQRLCVGQVEAIMELWNNNDDFRNEYIRCNTMSTLRRLRTLDGRSLGPDEEPPVLRNFMDEKVDNTVAASPKTDSSLPVTTKEQGRSIEPPLGPVKVEVKPVVNLEQKNPKAGVKSVVNLEKDPAVKSKKVSKPTALETGSVTISSREVVGVEDKKRREEEELARKAEELRKEEAAAKLKEQRRLEEKAKAKEAEERKKRNAEKAQAKAELRAKKEAELKEKEKEKRARKKERKVAAAALTEGTNGGIEGESAPSLLENTTQPETTNGQEQAEIKDKAGVVTKRKAQKQVVSVTKQTKVKALPPPLRNRGRRRMQTWMWVLVAAIIIVALFLVGNIGYSLKFSLPSSFGFF